MYKSVIEFREGIPANELERLGVSDLLRSVGASERGQSPLKDYKAKISKYACFTY